MLNSSNIDFGHWVCNISLNDDDIGFVYKITNKQLDKFYIGCKLLYKTTKRKPLKGKINKRHITSDSDWRIYCSSSGIIKEDIINNKDNYIFEIISFHKSKSDMKISEAKLIIDNIYNVKCYNEMVNLRIRVKK